MLGTAELAKACTDLRDGGSADAVDGVVPAVVATPLDVEELRELMTAAATTGLRMLARGGGTKLSIGMPPSGCDVLVDLRRLDAVVEHNPGDLIVKAQAGVPFEHMQAALSGHRQQLALDPPEHGATLGGIVAANASGPRRHRYGTARDLLIGITVALADATVAHAGGKVVKNVAGYDLMKLFTGSLGTLGVIVDTTWRLHPLPAARRVVCAAVDNPEAVHEVVLRLQHMPLTPVAVELDWPSRQLVAVFESSEPSAHAQATEVAQEFGASVDEALPDWFGQHPWGDGDVGLKISTTTTGVAAAIRAISELADGEARVRGRAAVGVLEVAVPSIDAESLARLRTALAGYDGSAVVVQALPEVKREIDVWGPVGNSLELMRRVKHRFDPEGRLSPGRFVGGI